MKKLILTILIILVTSTNINAQNNNNSLKFIGYSSKYRSTILEDIEGVALVINDRYNIYELFIPVLEDYSIILNSKEELFYYYNLYRLFCLFLYKKNHQRFVDGFCIILQ